MKAGEVLKKYNIHRNTLLNWVKKGLIDYDTSPSGVRDYLPKRDVQKDRKTIIYARVSTTAQKENLERQIERIKSFCSAKGIIVDDVLSDIASALNYNRKSYIKLREMIINKDVDKVVCEYKDRILRLGFEDFESLCKSFGTEVLIIDKSEKDKSKQQEITEDLVSIIHHFSMRIYSSRKRKKIIETITSLK